MKKIYPLIHALLYICLSYGADSTAIAYRTLANNPVQQLPLKANVTILCVTSDFQDNLTGNSGAISMAKDSATGSTIPLIPGFDRRRYVASYDLSDLMKKQNNFTIILTLNYGIGGAVKTDHNRSLRIIVNASAVSGVKEKSMSDIQPTGIAYYDAIVLDQLANKLKPRDSTLIIALQIISKYRNSPLTTADDWQAELSDNPFLLNLVNHLHVQDSIYRVPLAGGTPSNLDLSGISSSLSSFMTGTDITPYVVAIGQFLAERMKEEITMALIDRMKQMLDSVPELKYMLPNTYNTFVNTDPLNIPSMGQVYKESFLKDIENAPLNFEAMVNALPKYGMLKREPGYVVFMSSYHAVDLFAKGNHVPNVLKEVDLLYGSDAHDNDTVNYFFQRSLRIARLVSDGLRCNSDSASYVGVKDITALTEVQMRIFMGLIYEQDKDVFDNFIFDPPVDGELTLTGVINKNISSFQSNLNQLASLSVNIDQQIKATARIENNDTLSAKQKQTQALTYFLRNCDIISQALDFGFGLAYFKNPTAFRSSDYYTLWRPLVQDAIGIASAIPDKNYGAVVTSSVHAISQIIKIVQERKQAQVMAMLQNPLTQADIADLQDQLNAVDAELNVLIDGPRYDLLQAHRRDIQARLNLFTAHGALGSEATAQIKILASIGKFTEKLSFFYNFVTDMANADSSVAIKKILEKYADPPGSYKIKRSSAFSCSLNAYPGGYAGGAIHTRNDARGMFGITAPIGVSLNWGWCEKKNVYDQTTSNFTSDHDNPFWNKTGWSNSLFISLIDVGAALNLKFFSDSVSLPSKVTVLQILSPGLYYVLGVKNAPVSLMLGGEMMPELNQLSGDKSGVKTSTLFWLGGTLSVDIPVFHFVRRETKLLGY